MYVRKNNEKYHKFKREDEGVYRRVRRVEGGNGDTYNIIK